jgi:outer membrane protein TolC
MRIPTKVICTALWATFSLFSLDAQEELSLSQAIQTGLQNNYLLEITQNELSIAQGNNNWGQAGRYPSVNFNLISTNGYTDRVDPAIIFQPEISFFSGSVNATVDAGWVLFDGYRVRTTKTQLDKLEEMGVQNVALTVENTIQDIILAYYQVQIQAEQLGVVEEVLQLSSDRLEYQELRREYGQASTFDLLQTRDAYLSDSSNFLLQVNNFRNAMRNLNLAMGVDELDKVYVLTDPLVYEAPDFDLDSLRNRMLAGNNSLQALRLQRDLAGIQRDLVQSDRYPRVSVNGGLSYAINPRDNGDAINRFTNEPIGFTVGRTFNTYLNFAATYNLFDGGIRRRNVENAQVRELNAQLAVQDQQRLLLSGLENIYATYETQKDILEVAEALLGNARQNLNIAEERFRGGLINVFDLRTIQLGYINASQARLNAYFNLKNTETELVRLIGGLVR